MMVELQLIEDWYSFTHSVTEQISKFPRLHRYSIGTDIAQRCSELLGDLIRAKYAKNGPRKAEILRHVNIEIEVLRFHLRLAHDLKALSHRAHQHAVEQLQNCGRQLGGWIKSLETRDAK